MAPALRMVSSNPSMLKTLTSANINSRHMQTSDLNHFLSITMPERLFGVPEDNFKELEGVRWSSWWWLTGLVDNATKSLAELDQIANRPYVYAAIS